MTVVKEDSELVLSRTPEWSDKSMTVKKMPFTAKAPSYKQREVRDIFGQNAKAAAAETVDKTGADRVRAINEKISERQTGIRAKGLGPRIPPLPPPPEKEALPPGLPSMDGNREGDEYLKEAEINGE